jgi:hypothetical protein
VIYLFFDRWSPRAHREPQTPTVESAT